VFGLIKIICFVLLLCISFLPSCAVLPQNFERHETYALTDTDDTGWGRLLQAGKAAHPGQTGFILLDNGLDAFVARALLAKKAERSIDLQYYLYHDDLTGKLLTYELIKAADRGVRVRVLVDDMGLGGRDFATAILNSHPNIEVRIFNPFSRYASRLSQFFTRFGSVTRRMHNKSFIVDNQIVILGGRNIGDAYFDADPSIAFADLDVLAVGPVVKNVSASFDKYWNSEVVYPIELLASRIPTEDEIQEKGQKFFEWIARQQDADYIRALEHSDLANKIRERRIELKWGAAEVIYDEPEKVRESREKSELLLAPQIKTYMDRVEKELILLSPYIVPGEKGVEFMSELKKRGVEVKILTNSLAATDVGIVHSGYAKYRKDLLRAGIDLYELNKTISKKERLAKKGLAGSSQASLHAKTFVLDRRWIFIGSMNFDPRSVYENTEIGVMLDSSELARYMAQEFDTDIDKSAFKLELHTDENGCQHVLWHGHEDGKEQVFTVDPHTSFWRRLGTRFLGLLPIESQL